LQGQGGRENNRYGTTTETAAETGENEKKLRRTLQNRREIERLPVIERLLAKDRQDNINRETKPNAETVHIFIYKKSVKKILKGEWAEERVATYPVGRNYQVLLLSKYGLTPTPLPPSSPVQISREAWKFPSLKGRRRSRRGKGR
jgi:hypothetical protein